MFPVPSHLPHTGGDSVSSTLLETTFSEPSDRVLDFLSPLLPRGEASGSTGLSAKQVQAVRSRLQHAVDDNKSRGHELLISNFPSISTNIRLGSQSRSDLSKLREAVRKLEREIDPTDQEASFLPPVLALLSRHFSAVEERSRAQTHTVALKALSVYLDRLEKLEEAVYAGRGADDWVIEELERGFEALEGHEVLEGTKVMQAAVARMKLFRSMVTEQVTDGFAKAVAFSTARTDQSGASIKVQTRTSLQRPRIPRPEEVGSPANASVPPPYSLSHFYHVLDRLGVLSYQLNTLRTRLLRELITPVVASPDGRFWRVEESRSDGQSKLYLEHVPQKRATSDVLADISTILTYISTTVFLLSAPPVLERETFLSDLQSATLQIFLDHVVLPSMPSNLASVPSWLESVNAAVDYEKRLIASTATTPIIQPFYDSAAGPAWAAQRRRRVAEEVRKLVLGGWGGWEGVEGEREKEVVFVVEVEVDEEGEPDKPSQSFPLDKDEEMDYGWNLEDGGEGAVAVPPTAETRPDTAMEVDDDGGGWGFGEGPVEAGPSKPRQTPPADVNGDGWDFEEVTAATPVKPVPVAKPAREAKRLGKKVAKVKTTVNDDMWVSEAESALSSPEPNGYAPLAETTVDDWGDWANDDAPMTASSSVKPSIEPKTHSTKARKKVLREERRIVKETIMISRACAKLLETTERVLREAEDLRSSTTLSPSFSSASASLIASATDIFDIYRSLLPVHFAAQLRDVPTLAMQLYNDSLHLVAKISALHQRYHHWDAARDISSRLMVAGERVFEEQLLAQRDALMGVLDEAGGFLETGIEGSFTRCERAIKQVQRDLEGLAKILKPVLPTTTYMCLLGYLLDTAVQRISGEILSLVDITEIESNRLHDLVKLLQPLEALFVLQADQPSTIVAQVPHWLKFCYIAELLQANLVDLTYLLDTGALVDFSTAELVGLVRALFADSEKRDKAVERIESGSQGAVGQDAVA